MPLSPPLSQLLALSRCHPLLLPVFLGWLPCSQSSQPWAGLYLSCRKHAQPSACTGHLGGAMGGFLHFLWTQTQATAPTESLRSLRCIEPLQPPVPMSVAWAHCDSHNRFFQRRRRWRDIHRGHWGITPATWPHLAAPRWPICTVTGGGVCMPAVHWPTRDSGGGLPEGANRWQPPGATDWGHSVAWLPPEPTSCDQNYTIHTGLEA